MGKIIIIIIILIGLIIAYFEIQDCLKMRQANKALNLLYGQKEKAKERYNQKKLTKEEYLQLIKMYNREIMKIRDLEME